MRDTLSMLMTWVDMDFRLSVLVLILAVWLWPSRWQQEKAALNSSRNFPEGKQKSRTPVSISGIGFIRNFVRGKKTASSQIIANQNAFVIYNIHLFSACWCGDVSKNLHALIWICPLEGSEEPRLKADYKLTAEKIVDDGISCTVSIYQPVGESEPGIHGLSVVSILETPKHSAD